MRILAFIIMDIATTIRVRAGERSLREQVSVRFANRDRPSCHNTVDVLINPNQYFDRQ